MAVYIIVSASTRDWPMTSEWENLVAIAGALGETPETLERHSVPLIGEWNGEREHSRAIRVRHPRDVREWRDVHATAYRLREALGQEAVMILATREGSLTERYAREVFESVERVSIALPGRDEARRENLGTSTQTGGEPIVRVRNGSRWTTMADAEYGTHLVAFV